MTSRCPTSTLTVTICIYLILALAIISTTVEVEGCAQRREIQSVGCVCDEQADYFKIICPLTKNTTSTPKHYTIIMSKDNKYEIDCKNHVIQDMDFIPALLDKNRTIDYYGYNNCTPAMFQPITDKLFANSRKFKDIELKNIHHELPDHTLKGYQVDFLSIENNFFSQLPAGLLEYLPNLKAIYVNGNVNLQTIPATFFTYTKDIQVINLGSNSLKSLPLTLFANLTKLTQIQLFANQLSELDERQFESVPNVKVLELMTNKLETIPATLFNNMKQLQKVSLRKNRFVTLPSNLFAHNAQLQHVQLTDNPYLSQLPDALFANLEKLEEVYMHFCNLSSLPDNVFDGAVKLKTINLSNNKLKQLNRQDFSSLENLMTLSLERNRLQILEDYIFENNLQLKTLNLGYNQLIVKDFTFYGLRNLVSLNLEHNSLGDLTVRSFSFFRRLENLDMSYNNLTLRRHELYLENSILPQLDSLKRLNLRNNSITSIFSDWNLNLLQLEELNLANNKITELSYNDLQFLQDKTLVINLEYNQITTINLTSAELLLRQNLANNKAKKIVKLIGNPIHCDCRIYDFVRYLDRTMPAFVYEVLEIQIDDMYTPLTCQSPEKYKGQYLREINSRYLTCALHDGPKLPENCSMEHYEYQMFEKRLIINCSNNGLTKLPKIVVSRSDINFTGREIKVYLSGNRITSMPGPGMGYENVVELDLSYNFINEITWVPPNIQILRLDHNNLTYLNNAELSMINQTTITNVTFHNNPWICNCQLINFTKYLQENFKKIPKLHNITCANTEKRRELTQLTPEDLCPFSTLLIIVICAILVFAAMLTCILIAMYYRYNTQIKVWLYAHNMCLYLITEEEVDQDKPYDAFISFSHEDEDFVVNELMPTLEEGPNPFKLCVHFRDWQPGEFITTNIARSIEASRRTVVVVSKGFLNSEWGKMEFRTAHTEALKEGRARVIIIVYGDLGATDDLDPEIRAYLSTNTYVKWGSPWFWDSLRYALPHSSKYARIPEIVVKQPATIKRNYEDKIDLMYEPSTPPVATTPPADSLHRLHDPLLITPSALNVSLINGSLVNNYQEKSKQNNNIYDVNV